MRNNGVGEKKNRKKPEHGIWRIWARESWMWFTEPWLWKDLPICVLSSPATDSTLSAQHRHAHGTPWSGAVAAIRWPECSVHSFFSQRFKKKRKKKRNVQVFISCSPLWSKRQASKNTALQLPSWPLLSLAGQLACTKSPHTSEPPTAPQPHSAPLIFISRPYLVSSCWGEGGGGQTDREPGGGED